MNSRPCIMNTPVAALVLAALAATPVLFLTGCGPATPAHAAEEAGVVVGPQYSASKGLHVPEETRRALGLTTVEIAEQSVAGTLAVPLRVYDVTSGRARATGLLPAASARRLRVGQTLQVPAAGEAVVTQLTPAAGAKGGAWEILAELPASDSTAMGAFLDAKAELPVQAAAVTVPRSALLEAFDGTYVYTASGEYFVRTPVTPGVATADVVEIKDGLYAGDVVVASPVMSLWLTELAAIKGGHSCCVVPPEEK